jgi:hypothetical protein
MFIKITPKPLSDKSYIAICENKYDSTTKKGRCITIKSLGTIGNLKKEHENPLEYAKEELKKLTSANPDEYINLKLFPNNSEYRPSEPKIIGH